LWNFLQIAQSLSSHTFTFLHVDTFSPTTVDRKTRPENDKKRAPGKGCRGSDIKFISITIKPPLVIVIDLMDER
jgi:hypothetical protein